MRIEVKDPKFVYTIDLEENTLHDEAEELLRILSELKIDFESTRIRLNADADIVIDRESSSHFLTQLGNFDGLLRSFWNSIHTGTKTGIYLWPEHFDNAFIWYSGRKVNGSDEQIGIGVSNGDDEILLSYIYMNPWPVPLDIDKIELAEGTYFHSQGWTGFVLPYDQVQGKNGYEQQKELINNFFISTFEKINNEFKKR